MSEEIYDLTQSKNVEKKRDQLKYKDGEFKATKEKAMIIWSVENGLFKKWNASGSELSYEDYRIQQWHQLSALKKTKYFVKVHDNNLSMKEEDKDYAFSVKFVLEKVTKDIKPYVGSFRVKGANYRLHTPNGPLYRAVRWIAPEILNLKTRHYFLDVFEYLKEMTLDDYQAKIMYITMDNKTGRKFLAVLNGDFDSLLKTDLKQSYKTLEMELEEEDSENNNENDTSSLSTLKSLISPD